MENGHAEVTEGNGEPAEMDPYEKKYLTLLKRCENIQQNNERLVNRLHHVKKLLRRLRHERRFLMRRLGTHEDNYRDIPLILPIDTGMEEDESFGLAAAPDFPITPPPQTDIASPRASSILSSTLLSPPINSTSLSSPSAMWSSSKAGPSSSSQSAFGSGGLLGNCSSSIGHPSAASGSATATASTSACGAGTTTTTTNSKKKSRSDKDKERGKSKKMANSFSNFSSDQRKGAPDNFLNPSTKIKEEPTHREMPTSNRIGLPVTKSWNNLAQEEKKIPYDMYNGEKDVWLYGSISEDLPCTLGLEKKIVLMPGSAGTSLS